MELFSADFLSPHLLAIMFLVALVAGAIDAVAGGGGLIVMPAFLLAGVPPITALGTNRLQASIGELTSIVVYYRNGLLINMCFVRGAIFTGVGAIIGSIAASLMTTDALNLLLPVLMGCILIYTIFSKKIRDNIVHRQVLSVSLFMSFMGIVLGFYNGFFGPGTGSLWLIAFVTLLGSTLREASIYSKPLNFVSNLISLIFFIAVGEVSFALGGVMAMGQVIGATFGSRLVISNGERIVRPLFICVVSMLTAKLILQAWFS